MENLPHNRPLLLSSKDSPALSTLARWEPQNPSPLAKDELSTVIADLSEAMKPATTQQYAQAMVALIEFAAAFGIPCQEPDAVQKIYHETLKHLPADLLNTAIARVKKTWVWGNRMPFPADIANQVKDDYAKRRSLLSRAQVAMLKAPETNGQKNVISAERWEELRRTLRAVPKTMAMTKSPRVSTNDGPPLEEPTPEELESLKRAFIAQCEE